MENIQICCPKCEWEPDGKPYWNCSCGHQWDTFTTGGRCPECKKVWEETQCIACDEWSPHLDWYRGLDDVAKEITEAIKENWKTTV
jgi:hypothetical protein